MRTLSNLFCSLFSIVYCVRVFPVLRGLSPSWSHFLTNFIRNLSKLFWSLLSIVYCVSVLSGLSSLSPNSSHFQNKFIRNLSKLLIMVIIFHRLLCWRLVRTKNPFPKFVSLLEQIYQKFEQVILVIVFHRVLRGRLVMTK